MSNLLFVSTVTFVLHPSARLNDCIREAINFSRVYGWHERGKKSTLVSFDYSGVAVTVAWDSNPELIVRDWSRAHSGYIEKSVGPYPNAVLTDDEMENDARIEEENERRCLQQASDYQIQRDSMFRANEALFANAPEMEVVDKDAWMDCKSNSQDGYNGIIISVAERWARLIQVQIAYGEIFEPVAYATLPHANIFGISDSMIADVVNTLANHWRYGVQLSTWYCESWRTSDNTVGAVIEA